MMSRLYTFTLISALAASGTAYGSAIDSTTLQQFVKSVGESNCPQGSDPKVTPYDSCGCTSGKSKEADSLNKLLAKLRDEESHAVVQVSGQGMLASVAPGARNAAQAGSGVAGSGSAGKQISAALKSEIANEAAQCAKKFECSQDVSNVCNNLAKMAGAGANEDKAASSDLAQNAAGLAKMAQGLQSMLGKGGGAGGDGSGNPYDTGGPTGATSNIDPNSGIGGSGVSIGGTGGASTADATKGASAPNGGFDSSGSSLGGYSSDVASNLNGSSADAAGNKMASLGGGNASGSSMSGSLSSSNGKGGASGASIDPSTAPTGYEGGGGSFGSSKKSSLGLKSDPNALDGILGSQSTNGGRALASDDKGGLFAADGKKVVAGADSNLFKQVGEKIREYKNIRHRLL